MGHWASMVYLDLDSGEFFPVPELETTPITRLARYVIPCKFCKDENTVRHGRTSNGNPRWMCRNCGRTFVDNNSVERGRYPIQVMASAINRFYEANSLHKIQRQLALDFGASPDVSNIYRWIARYTKKAVRLLEPVPIHVGDIWVADETVLRTKAGKRKIQRRRPDAPFRERPGARIWMWDCIDQDTRFLLATHLTQDRTIRQARTLMEKSARRAMRAPRGVVTDKLRAYVDGVDLTFGALTRHVRTGPFVEGEISTRPIERLHGTIKDRTKVLRALANIETSRLFILGWAIHYNFFRPHSGLDGMTPAQAAGAKTPIRNWADVVRSDS